MGALINLFSAFGLSSAAGLNAYLPLLVVGLVGRYTDLWQLQAPYDLLATPAVLITIGVLAAVDFLADKIPVVDHIAHTVGTVVHPVAGAVLFASQSNVLTNIHPVVALLAGFVVAGGFHAGRTTIRPVATATTGGVANPILSFLEDITSAVLTVLAILAPVVAFVLFLVLVVALVFGFRRVRGFVHRRASQRT